MSIQSNITTGKETFEGILTGIELVSSAIRPTYGPGGVNASIEVEDYPYHVITNDAQTIIQAIHTDDTLAKRGLNFLKELSDKAHKDSGDGRKTTIILAEEILKKGGTKEELDKALPNIIKAIDDKKREITIDEVKDVATVASESPAIGEIIQEIYHKIGKNGRIEVEGSGTYDTFYEFIDGVKFDDATMLSPYLSTENGKAIYENPKILVTKQKISTTNEVNGILNLALQKPLVIFTDDMDTKVAELLIDAYKNGGVKIVIIKAPIILKNQIFEDFAKCVGATIVEPASGVNFKNLSLEHLGTCDKITVDDTQTVVRGIKDLTSHITSLKAKGDNESLFRAFYLSTKSAVLKIGAGSESELSYKRLKAQDAVNSSRLALEEGVVKGGGQCLYEISHTIDNPTLREVLKAPYEQIRQNMGVSPQDKIEFGNHIVDSTKVIKNAIMNAVSLAGIVLTTKVDIAKPKKSFEDKQLEILASKQRPF